MDWDLDSLNANLDYLNPNYSKWYTWKSLDLMEMLDQSTILIYNVFLELCQLGIICN